MWERPVAFDNDKHKKNYPAATFDPFGGISAFVHHRPPKCDISLALAILWKSPVRKTATEWVAEEMHANVLVIVHAPHDLRGGRIPGKVIAIADPNFASETGNPLSGRINSLLRVRRVPTTRFVSLPRAESNGKGICLALALEWLVEMVVKGVNIERDEETKEVIGIQGFRPI